MTYQALARKWRPQTFDQLAGQQHIIRALRNTLKLQRLHHAYLFCGTRGVGKTTLARILAKCFNCEQGPAAVPCGSCAACTQIEQGCFIDLIEIDAASRTGVDEMRELIESVQYMPSAARFKIYLIDEVHMLSMSSFNALLKTLEEPPEHVKFFFATTHPQKLPVTILSRCLQFNLTRLLSVEIEDYLALQLESEQIAFEKPALRQIALVAEGSVRDALSLLDQAIVHGGGALRLKEVEAMLGVVAQQEPVQLLQYIQAGDADGLLKKVDQLYANAVDFSSVLASLLTLLHEIALVQAAPKVESGLQFERAVLDQFACGIAAEDLQLFYQIAVEGRKDMSFLPSIKNAFEMIVLRMLSFRPLTAAQTAASKAAAPTAKSLSPAAEHGEAPMNAVAEVPTPAVAEQQKSAAGMQASQADESPAVATLAQIHSTQDWQDLINRLPLEGSLQALCCNTRFKYVPPDQVLLLVDPKNWNDRLHDEKRAEKLVQVFCDHFNTTIRLEFRREDTEQKTPSEAVRKVEAQRRAEHETNLKQNPVIQGLQTEMGAKIAPSSDKKSAR